MDRPFFERQSAAVRTAFELEMGCHVAVETREELTVVDRPAATLWPYVAMAATFGDGMVVSVDPAYRAFAGTLELETAEAAAWPLYLGRLAAEVQRRGADVSASPIALLFALATAPSSSSVDLPDDLELRRFDPDWMLKELPSGRFRNALGSSGERARAGRNRFAYALIDQTGEPVALSGVFDTLGLHEIGVDVVPAAQGRGLAPIVVAAAAHAILEAGETPLYACAATNIRSQRTALAAGFVPVGADAFVS